MRFPVLERIIGATLKQDGSPTVMYDPDDKRVKIILDYKSPLDLSKGFESSVKDPDTLMDEIEQHVERKKEEIKTSVEKALEDKFPGSLVEADPSVYKYIADANATIEQMMKKLHTAELTLELTIAIEIPLKEYSETVQVALEEISI